jgi:hypothetical protein
MARLKSFDKIDTIVDLTVSSSKKKKTEMVLEKNLLEHD